MHKTKTKHHHGDLREALISAGVELVHEGGVEALTIRGAAARVGVSHAAPKHHFPTLAHLRTAVAARSYQKFHAAMKSAIEEEASEDPQAIAVAAAVGYFRFARANPSLFQVMFSTDGVNYDDEELGAASSAAYGLLEEISAPVATAQAGTNGTEILIWSLAHGFSSLALLGQFGGMNAKDQENFLKQIFPLALFQA